MFDDSDDVLGQGMYVGSDTVFDQTMSLESNKVLSQSVSLGSDEVLGQSLYLGSDKMLARTLSLGSDVVLKQSMSLGSDEALNQSLYLGSDEVSDFSLSISSDEVINQSPSIRSDNRYDPNFQRTSDNHLDAKFERETDDRSVLNSSRGSDDHSDLDLSRLSDDRLSRKYRREQAGQLCPKSSIEKDDSSSKSTSRETDYRLGPNTIHMTDDPNTLRGSYDPFHPNTSRRTDDFVRPKQSHRTEQLGPDTSREIDNRSVPNPLRAPGDHLRPNTSHGTDASASPKISRETDVHVSPNKSRGPNNRLGPKTVRTTDGSSDPNTSLGTDVCVVEAAGSTYEPNYEKGLVELYASNKNDIEKWKKDPLQVAVVGAIGAGKSSFINAMLGFRSTDVGAAKTGLGGTTNIRRAYILPDHPNIVLWDVPGFGSKQCTQENYLETICLETYDVVIIMSATGFTENEAWLAHELQKVFKQAIFVKSKIDIDVKNAIEDTNNSYNEDEIVTALRKECVKSLTDFAFKFNDKLPIISNRYPFKYDFERLKMDIINNADAMKRNSMKYKLKIKGEEVITNKTSSLQANVKNVVRRASWWNLIPFKNVYSILFEEAKKYPQQYGVDDTSMSFLAGQMNMSLEALKRKFDLRSALIVMSKTNFEWFCKTIQIYTPEQEEAYLSMNSGFFSFSDDAYRWEMGLVRLMEQCHDEFIQVINFQISSLTTEND